MSGNRAVKKLSPAEPNEICNDALTKIKRTYHKGIISSLQSEKNNAEYSNVVRTLVVERA